jgi:uncharacterized protein (UPF0262 family)
MTIAQIALDDSLNIRLSPEIDRERRIAIDDLLHGNHFHCETAAAPYHVTLSLADRAVRFTLQTAQDKAEEGGQAAFSVALPPFRRLIKDYFLVCESYYKTARLSSHAHIEAIDMGRRALHDEAAALLKTKLAGCGVKTDLPTARRLFTLICVLHIRIMY